MNMLKRGPELKLSEIKVPDAVLDVYWDLRDRHLLPLVVLLLVALVAVPIALSQASGSAEPEEAVSVAPVATPSAAGGSAELVATSAPGLRRYKRRLAHLHAKDPFKQQFVESEGSSEGPGGAAEGETGGSAPAETSVPGSTTEAPSENGPPLTVHSKLTYYSYAIDVRVVTGGSQNGAKSSSAGEEGGSGEAKQTKVRRNLPELTMLPSRETPAAIYMGSTKDGKKALMLISSNVEAIFGDGKCVLGSTSCQLLELEPGVPETFVYGGQGRTFKIELLKIHLVETNKLNRAPLGKPKQHSAG